MPWVLTGVGQFPDRVSVARRGLPVEFAILGPLEITVADRHVDVPGARPRKILGALLLAPDGRISVDRLVAAVWDAHSPSTAYKQVQNCAAALRRRLIRAGGRESLLQTRPNGYQLNVRPQDLDARMFVDHVTSARRMDADNRADEAVRSYRLALGMWRGPVLDDLDSQAVAAGAAWLTELRLAAAEELFDLELRRGRHEQSVADLVHLCAEFPARERLHGQLMLALHRSDRQVDSCAVYRRLQRHLADELGVSPGAGVVRLHRELLAQCT
jgi:DNA-binding SARP family transcriptional activator